MAEPAAAATELEPLPIDESDPSVRSAFRAEERGYDTSEPSTAASGSRSPTPRVPLQVQTPTSSTTEVDSSVERVGKSKSMAPISVPTPSSPSASRPIGAGASDDTKSPTSALRTKDKRKDVKRERGKGLTEGDHLMEALPDNNLLIVMPSIGLVLFLSALDQTIVATALPVIAADLHATAGDYSWVATIYFLGMVLMTPINGRVSDIIGRKPMLYAAIIIFVIFSALCGAAQNIDWLIACRFFQGVGGGSIIGLTNIVISDIVPLHKRGLYGGYIGATWGIASVLGPILGGILSDKASWRWVFWINLPTGGVALTLLIICLKLNPARKLTLRQFCKTFDFLGLILIMLAGALLIVGFSNAADNGFNAKNAYPIIIVGVVCLVATIVNCLLTTRIAIIPARMFKIRTTLLWLIGSFTSSMSFIPINFLLPQLFQGVRGSSVIMSGVQLLPYAVSLSLATIVAGQINARLRIIRPVAWFGYVMAAIGFGLQYRYFRYPFSVGVQEGLQLVVGIGLGLSLAVPMLILQAAMPLKEMGATTTAWQLLRSLGGSIGLAIFTGVLNADLQKRFRKIPGYGTEFTAPASASGYKALHDLPNGPTKDAVLLAFSESIGLCWIIGCALVLFSLVITLWTKSYSLNRPSGAAAAAQNGDPEAGKADQAAGDSEKAKEDDADDVEAKEQDEEQRASSTGSTVISSYPDGHEGHKQSV